MRIHTRAVVLIGCVLVLGLWLFMRTRSAAGTLAGQVTWIGTEAARLSPDTQVRILSPGQRLRIRSNGTAK